MGLHRIDCLSCCIVQISDGLYEDHTCIVVRCASSSPTERNMEMCMFAFHDFFSPSIFYSLVFNVCVPHFIALSIPKHP